MYCAKPLHRGMSSQILPNDIAWRARGKLRPHIREGLLPCRVSSKMKIRLALDQFSLPPSPSADFHFATLSAWQYFFPVLHPSLCCHKLMSVLPSLSFLSKTAPLLLLLLQKTASLLIQNLLPATCCCCRPHSSVNSGNPASKKLLLLLLTSFLSITCF